jgi:exopolysaccharide biosynthesis polyprenyl glycosylphosphotransferase
MSAVDSASGTSLVGQLGRRRRPDLVAPGFVRPEHVRLQARGSRGAKVAVVAVDAILILIAMETALWLRMKTLDTEASIGPILITGAIALPIWLCVFARYKLYTAAAVTSVSAEIGRVIHGVATGVACTAIISLFVGTATSRAWLVLTFLTAVPIIVAGRSVVRSVFRHARTKGRLQRRVLVVGTNAEALSVVQMLRANPSLGYDVLGLLKCNDDIPPISPVQVLGRWEEAPNIVADLDASGVIVATSAIETVVANRLARELIEMGCHVELTSGLVDISADRLIARPLGRRPVMYIEPVKRVGWRAVAKRMFDVAVAAFGLVFAAPVVLAVAIATKLDSPGPVFFSQERIGKDGELFPVRKLRSMVVDAEQRLEDLRDQSEADGPLFKMRHDPRLTRVGRFLRATSIDELPQLWNVLRGEMSVVGPRPALASEAAEWSEDLRGRLRVKPGITGMWQVNGRSSASFDDYARHDLYYVDNWSLLTDLAIVAKTIPVVLGRRGAY